MYKKIFALATAVVMLSALVSNAQGIKVETVSKSDMYDTVTINVENEASDGWLTIAVYSDNGEQMSFWDQARLKETNTFSYILTPDKTRNDEYTVKVTRTSKDGTVNSETTTFSYYTYAQKATAITEIKRDGTISEENAKILSLDISQTSIYADLADKSAVVTLLKEISDLKPENIVENFDKSVIKAAYTSKNATVLKKMLERYKDSILPASANSLELGWYNSFGDDYFFSLLARKQYADETAFSKEVCALAYLYAVKNQPYLSLNTFLAQYDAKYEQDGQTYPLGNIGNLSEAIGADKAETVMYNISDKLYESLYQLQNAYDEAVTQATQQIIIPSLPGNVGSTVSPSGSSSSMSGGVSIVPSGTASEGNEASAENQRFNDLGVVAWAVEAINSLSDKGIINGIGDNRFDPQSPVTREQFAKMAVIAFGLSGQSEESLFSDSMEGSWYVPYINACKNSGVMQGRGNSFGVGENISRQEMATVLYRIISKKYGVNSINNNEFSDKAQISDYALEAVSTMSSLGIINGNTDGTFAPLQYATRAQSAKLIYEAMNFINK